MKTLCDWKKKDIQKNWAELEALVRDPMFMCRKCARTANGPKALCKPLRLFREKSAAKAKSA